MSQEGENWPCRAGQGLKSLLGTGQATEPRSTEAWMPLGSSPNGSTLRGCRRPGTRGQGGYLRRGLHAGPEPHVPGSPWKTPGLQGGLAQKEVPPLGLDLAGPGTVSVLEKLPADAGPGMEGPDELSGVTGIPEGRESEKVRQDFGVEGGPPEKSQQVPCTCSGAGPPPRAASPAGKAVRRKPQA